MIEDAADSLRHLRSATRPIIFKTGIEQAPVSTAGSGILVGFGARIFVVTAAHVVRGVSTRDILVVPSDTAKRPFRLIMGYRAEIEVGELDDFDLHFYDASMQGMHTADLASTRLLRLDDPSSWDWMPGSYTAQFFLCGYPQSLENEVDYKAGVVNTTQVMLAGHYIGGAYQPDVHAVMVENPLALNSFSGMSGGPVFSLEMRFAAPAVIRFCGIILAGTCESGIVHFLEARAVVQSMKIAIKTQQSLDASRLPEKG